MLKIEKYVTASPEQWEIVIEGMRNPKNSWDRMDSYATYIENPETLNTAAFEYFIGENDMKLMEALASGGPVHGKFMRMIPCWVTISAPLYWWKQFDTYKVGTVGDACSTMHKIHAKEFTLDDFAHEYLVMSTDDYREEGVEYDVYETVRSNPLHTLTNTVIALNKARKRYLFATDKLSSFVKTDDMSDAEYEAKKNQLRLNQKKFWYQMIQLLPDSYIQKRTIFLNYEVLRNMYISRKNHKLDEWHTFCDWVKTLPYFELITETMKEV